MEWVEGVTDDTAGMALVGWWDSGGMERVTTLLSGTGQVPAFTVYSRI